MLDLSPSWDEGTIALLVGMSLHSTTSNNVQTVPVGSVVVEMMPTKNASECNVRAARLQFSSPEEKRRVVEAYQELAVPMTHGYHYYRFSDDGEGNIEGGESAKYAGGGAAASHNNCGNVSAAETPPLHLQLMAVPTKELDRRIQMLICSSGTDTNSRAKKRKGSNKRCRVHAHASKCYQLCRHFHQSRPQRQVLGVPAPPGSANELLQYLRACTLWPSAEKQRKGVSAGNYLTVRQQHPPDHDEVWNLCRDLIGKVVPDAVYTALAITKAFVGSPHVDNHDKTFQHVIALGNFEGGMLCCEADGYGTETLAIDVRNRFGRIDGRGVHWVSRWNGERYSVVYYSTSKEDHTDRVPQRVHTEWMKTMQA